jgi:hypothetical protein
VAVIAFDVLNQPVHHRIISEVCNYRSPANVCCNSLQSINASRHNRDSRTLSCKLSGQLLADSS